MCLVYGESIWQMGVNPRKLLGALRCESVRRREVGWRGGGRSISGDEEILIRSAYVECNSNKG